MPARPGAGTARAVAALPLGLRERPADPRPLHRADRADGSERLRLDRAFPRRAACPSRTGTMTHPGGTTVDETAPPRREVARPDH